MKNENTLTNGNVYKGILIFALPILLGNLFQQFYNIADSLIVGNFLGSNALAAVSSAGSLIFLLVGFFQGLSMGGGILLARYFGAKDNINIEKVVHVSVGFGLLVSILLTILGITFTPLILDLMGTPETVIKNSISYFQVYFAGSIGFVMYNSFVGILQAIGDSKRPLFYLMISTIINIILDLLFIGVFKMGVGSAALATIISQLFSAYLCLIRLTKTDNVYKLNIKRVRIEKDILKKIIQLGLPAGFQNSIISFANIIVQSNINMFGELAMAGCGAFNKIEGFAFLPITSFSMSLTTFVSQNLGADNIDRIKKGVKFGVVCSMILAQTMGIVLLIFPEAFISIFDKNPIVIEYGVRRIEAASLFFFVLAYSHCTSAVLRGAGKSKVSMMIMLLCWCVIRVSILEIAMPIFNSIEVVNYVYPITWTLSSLCFYYYYRRIKWENLIY